MGLGFLDSSIPKKFWDRVVPEPMSGCWLWVGCVDKDGYGIVYRRLEDKRRTTVPAHHITLTAVAPRPPGLETDHQCSTRICVNPDHLQWVTHRRNVELTGERGRSRGRRPFDWSSHPVVW